ncbi:DUF3380 domain-containing protein [Rhodovulum sulfidophilum]|uniref:N-acetylmuramidase domain-containing protein n=1 Tax=Rhodovulum sulfidophilum TaxID=35806 RepID=UPI0019127507|nr:N-acetylmuramidase domain-containing protein [Rhodovulum sulfidophilum]MBL3587319.1 DUF3380 domain-containing protein [Rhodovulum sulfidophilum]
MSYPWHGRAAAMSGNAWARAASDIGCKEAAIRAVWEVEAAGSGFRSDGSLQRRFEPHCFPAQHWGQIGFAPGGLVPWRASLKVASAERERMFAVAYQIAPEAALDATSWGGPQILGSNAEACGYASALEMVRDMAQGEDRHLAAFVLLIRSWGLDSALRARDWKRFATRYNGPGQPEVYARKIEAAYRRHSGGTRSPAVLRRGDQGAEVKRLQQALGLPSDGVFGPATDSALRRFQAERGLTVDGMAGANTWDALQSAGTARPAIQKTPGDALVERGVDWLAKGGAGAAATAGLGKAAEKVPDGAVAVASYGAVVIALVVAAVLILGWARRCGLV